MKVNMNKENIMLDLFDNVVTSFFDTDSTNLAENVKSFKASMDQHLAARWGRSFSKELDKHINVYSARYHFDSRCEEVAYLSNYLLDVI